jgi:WD40 repeat protein
MQKFILRTAILLFVIFLTFVSREATLSLQQESILSDVFVLQVPRVLQNVATPIDISFNATGTLLAAIYTDATIKLWNIESGAVEKEFFFDEYMWGDIAFAPSGDAIAVTTGMRQSAVFLIDVENGSPIQTFNPFSSYDVLFTPDNRSLIVADWAAFHVFDLQSGETIVSKTNFPMGSVSIGISHDGRLLAVAFSGSPSNPVRLYDTQNWESLGSFGFFSVGGASSVALSPNSHWVVSGHCESLAFWDISSSEKIQNLTHDAYSEPNFEIPVDGDCVDHIDFSADGSLLIAGNRDMIRLWRTSDYELIQSTPGHLFALSSDGKQLAVTQGDSIQLWELRQN